MKILIIEDHPKLRENISKFLKISGYVAETALHGEEALEKITLGYYDVIVLDINMPIMNGKQFIVELRKKGENIPVLALTSNSLLDDKLEMFDLGVDDYLTKPFELKELEARIKALGKRKEKEIEDNIIIQNLKIDVARHKVFLKSAEIVLLNKEYLILEYLAINKGFPKTKAQILEKVWGELEENLELSSTTLEAHISTLRKKLGKEIIKTIRGVGYIIE